MNIDFTPITSDNQIELLSRMAYEIWREYYITIISSEQIEYMIEKYQSFQSIRSQIINEGCSYFFITNDNIPIGYFCYKTENHKMFLSKFYILKQHRRNGFGSRTIDFLQDTCLEKNLSSIWLTVNRFNTDSINAYKKKGFIIKCMLASDIGNGFIMDDYIMEKAVLPTP